MFPEYLFPYIYSATFVFLQSLKKKSDFPSVVIVLFALKAQLWHAGCVLYPAVVKWFSVALMEQRPVGFVAGAQHLCSLDFCCFLSRLLLIDR